MKLVEFPTHLIGAGAITVYPFVLISPRMRGLYRDLILEHEQVHLEQQGLWYRRAWVFGLLAWYLLYLLALPFGWNPWRRKWETAAYRAQGTPDEEINAVLRKAPYWLWS